MEGPKSNGGYIAERQTKEGVAHSFKRDFLNIALVTNLETLVPIDLFYTYSIVIV